ncbi:hypothetical protein EDB84DRAFT_1564999 [Lactarius hengduanensis]|nr:hypothetical protein EDB84DRAFT_1564999 [Lactarius hengduanensis]
MPKPSHAFHWQSPETTKRCCLLKTPNIISGLDPTDIPILCQDPADVDLDHITLQQLKKHHNDNPVLLATLTNMGALNPLTAFSNGGHMDAKFQSTGGGPLIILDYIYGIATYQHWGNKQLEGHGLLEHYYEQNYAHISASLLCPDGGTVCDLR